MASQFQNRLIGTVILVAIGVIVLPDVFDGQKEHYKESFASIPIKPSFDDENNQAKGHADQVANNQTATDKIVIQEPIEVDTSKQREDENTLADNSVALAQVEQNNRAPSSSTSAGDNSPEPSDQSTSQSTNESTSELATVSTSTSQSNNTSSSTRDVNSYEKSAWIIQLVALKNADNAKILLADLQAQGYQANLKVGDNINFVSVGPDVSKEKLEKQIIELQKITGLKGQLRKFNPIN